MTPSFCACVRMGKRGEANDHAGSSHHRQCGRRYKVQEVLLNYDDQCERLKLIHQHLQLGLLQSYV